jgi:hypothetical protein
MDHDFEAPSSPESVTEWLVRLKAGDQAAGQQLWQRYLDPLIRLAERKLGAAPRTMADEEDVALSADRGENLTRTTVTAGGSVVEFSASAEVWHGQPTEGVCTNGEVVRGASQPPLLFHRVAGNIFAAARS